MISFTVLFRAVLVASVILVSADDHTMQCVAKFRPVPGNKQIRRR